MRCTVTIDCFPERAALYKGYSAIVAVDVIRATTTAVTAVHAGMQVFPTTSVLDALTLSRTYPKALLAGEVDGVMPSGFNISNSPVEILEMSTGYRQVILLSSSGTKLIVNSASAAAVYICCFRNLSAIANHLTGNYEHVAILGAGSKDQFRREDKMGCAYLASRLFDLGFQPANAKITDFVREWAAIEPSEASKGRSASYLLNSGQSKDLDFILDHIDDLEIVPALSGNEIVPIVRVPPMFSTLTDALNETA